MSDISITEAKNFELAANPSDKLTYRENTTSSNLDALSLLAESAKAGISGALADSIPLTALTNVTLGLGAGALSEKFIPLKNPGLKALQIATGSLLATGLREFIFSPETLIKSIVALESNARNPQDRTKNIEYAKDATGKFVTDFAFITLGAYLGHRLATVKPLVSNLNTIDKTKITGQAPAEVTPFMRPDNSIGLKRSPAHIGQIDKSTTEAILAAEPSNTGAAALQRRAEIEPPLARDTAAAAANLPSAQILHLDHARFDRPFGIGKGSLSGPEIAPQAAVRREIIPTANEFELASSTKLPTHVNFNDSVVFYTDAKRIPQAFEISTGALENGIAILGHIQGRHGNTLFLSHYKSGIESSPLLERTLNNALARHGEIERFSIKAFVPGRFNYDNLRSTPVTDLGRFAHLVDSGAHSPIASFSGRPSTLTAKDTGTLSASASTALPEIASRSADIVPIGSRVRMGKARTNTGQAADTENLPIKIDDYLLTHLSSLRDSMRKVLPNYAEFDIAAFPALPAGTKIPQADLLKSNDRLKIFIDPTNKQSPISYLIGDRTTKPKLLTNYFN